MKVLISGANGLVGKALWASLDAAHHTVGRLARPGAAPKPGDVAWDPERGLVDAPGLEGLDAVVHLAGDNIAEGRWDDAKKARIRDSRVKGTRALADALARAKQKPKVLVCASAIGWYGDRGEELCHEGSKPGTGFLPEVCLAWELAADPARAAGIRVVHARIGVVLAPDGGALAKMYWPFFFGLGGVVGPGTQWMSWVVLEDVVAALRLAIETEGVSGALNVVSPTPVTNHEFTKTLGKVMGRPTFCWMPAFVARLALGEMADALLLASTRVEPRKLNALGYRFRDRALGPALARILAG